MNIHARRRTELIHAEREWLMIDLPISTITIIDKSRADKKVK